jgi:hypothetical protein
VKRIASAILAAAVLTGCDPTVSQQDLAFLATQKKPLTANDVGKRLGQVEIGPGPYYSYRMAGEKKTVQFWIGPPPAAAAAPASGIPIEIAVVSVKPENGKDSVIWPAELKGKELEDALAPFWPQTNNQANQSLHSTPQ